MVTTHYVPRMVLVAACRHLRDSGRPCDVVAATPEEQQNWAKLMRPFKQADGRVVYRCVSARS